MYSFSHNLEFLNMRFLILVILSLIVICLSASQQIWNECGSGNTLKIEQLSFDPPEPVKGKNITITAKGNLVDTITLGNVHVREFGCIY